MRSENKVVHHLATWIGLGSLVVFIGAVLLTFRNPSQVVDNGTTITVPYPGPSQEILPLDEQATQAFIATIVALKNAEATTAIFEFTASPYVTPPPGATGIREDEYSKLEMRKTGLDMQNSWGGIVDGNSASVWAGALIADSNQGIVHVIYSFPAQTLEQRYQTPDKHGSLRIIDEENNRLTLLASDGTIFYFDVPALAFVSSLTEIAPNITPLPT
jgi:hypothetical protein